MNSATPDKLPVGILIRPGQLFERWEIAVFERLANNSSIDLVAFILAPDFQANEAPSLIRRLLHKLERRLFCPQATAKKLELPEELTRVPQIRIEDCQTIGIVPQVVISHIPGWIPDKECPLPSEIWEYHFHLGGRLESDDFGMREILEGAPVTRTALVSIAGNDELRVVGSFRTNTKFSGAFNAHYAKAMLPSLVERELLKTSACENVPPHRSEEDVPVPSALSGAELPRYWAKVLSGAFRKAVQSLSARIGGTPNRWSLFVSQGNILQSPLDELEELPQPKGEYRADPFLFEMDGQKYVFFESWNGRGSSGRIFAGILDGSDIRDIQPLDFGDIHLSYPYVFAHGGDIYMVPETHERKRVEVWRCTQFPVKWELHATALQGKSPADTMILQHKGEWWLLTSLCTGSILDHCMELHAFRIDGPDLGKVEPHRLNPVVIDTTRGRNGGRPFLSEGKLIRPAQSSDHGLYGYGLRLMEITQLSLDEFEEREIRRIEPVPGRSTTGCHHVDISGDLFILDARRSFGSRMFGAREIALRAT